MTNPACKQMKTVIESLLVAHGLLEQFNAGNDFYAKIENRPYMPLSIERHDGHVMVAHYYEQNGDLIPDPDMEFRLGKDGAWYPFAIQLAIGIYRCCYKEREDGQELVNLREVRDQRSFSNMWAKNIKAQGFAKGTVARTQAD